MADVVNDDRELLEMAAKAAGYELWWDYVDGENVAHLTSGAHWTPRTDDGDALRLAVDLNIDMLKPPVGNAAAWDDSDRYAKQRHAILRVAAEIGRAVPT